MTDGTPQMVFLGVIALATLVMAIIQVGAVIAAGKLARRVDRLADQVENDIKPLLANLTEVGKNASQASALAAAQMQRVDELFATLTRRVDETLAMVQAAIITPAREGKAVVTAVRAAVIAFREMRAARQRGLRHEDEDALFIG